jgi:hypothetical protein
VRCQIRAGGLVNRNIFLLIAGLGVRRQLQPKKTNMPSLLFAIAAIMCCALPFAHQARASTNAVSHVDRTISKEPAYQSTPKYSLITLGKSGDVKVWMVEDGRRPHITDVGLASLLTMTNLTGLDLRGCPGITDAGLELLATKTNWQTIMFGGCRNVTTNDVAKLQRALPHAEVEKDEREWSFHK